MLFIGCGFGFGTGGGWMAGRAAEGGGERGGRVWGIGL